MEKKKVFVIMPFEDLFFEVYEMIKMQFEETFEFSNAGEEGNQQNILKDIIQPIFEADIVLADLTGLNFNVLYELGIAHTLNKKTIVITQDEISQLPFDLKSYRAKNYKTHFKKFAELISYLEINLNGAIDGSIAFSNPVKDFLSIEKNEYSNWFVQEAPLVLGDNSEKGFIDFLAEIEENVEILTTETQAMIEDMEKMTDGTNTSSAEIERVNKSGGNGTAAFIRKEVKKVAGYIEIFSTKLRQRNVKFNELWDKVENNTLGLIENRFASTDENKKQIIVFLKSLKEAQFSMKDSQESTYNLMGAMEANLGIERSMNQAIRFIEEGLTDYLNFTNRVCSSIDKIFSKSRFIVGDIDFQD